MNLEQYLNRINFRGVIKADLETLIELHQLHVLSIPFEDLDIHLNNPITLDLETLFEKIVSKNRGGFCYELNNLFYNLLVEIGFDCKIISSRIYDEENNLGPEFDHMSIIVKLKDQWLIDVGYGDLFIEPIRVKDNYIKKDRFKYYRINKIDANNYLLSESRDGKSFKRRYQFGLISRRVEEFNEQCGFKQYSENSYFVKNRICTLPTKNGRITLFNDKLIKRIDGIREEFQIQSESILYEILQSEFEITLLNEKIRH